MKHQIVIVGGGAAGIAVSASLLRKDKSLDVAIIEPADKHYYQPAFTLVGGGAYDLKKTERSEADCIPAGAKWIKESASSFNPEQNSVDLSSGETASYEYLVVCPGLQLDWNKVEGLEETLGKDGVCSIYLPHLAEYTWECVRNFKGGRALFTQPAMPIKCAGAPQKIMYLTADHARQHGFLDTSEIEFCLTGDALFGVQAFVPPLQKVVDRYRIKVNYKHTLVSIDGAKKQTVFEVPGADSQSQRVNKSFDMIHVTPPQSAPDFIKQSPLANAAGWVDIDRNTMQHTRYENIFSLGDVGSSPNAKTAAAVRLQSPVVVKNLLSKIKNQPMESAYDGYGSCPLVTSYRSVILAEFCYDGKVTPSFPLDPTKERYSMWLLKQKFLPHLYWDWMLKGHEWDLPHRTRDLPSLSTPDAN